MSPVDPRELSASRSGQTIETDRSCENCGYDLKGLRIGGRCPECGTPIAPKYKPRRVHDNLSDAPMGYLRKLRIACVLMSGTVMSFFGVILLSILTFLLPVISPVTVLAAVVLLPLAVLAWPAGVFMATSPRRSAAIPESETRGERRVMRPTARISQLCWPPYVAVVGLQAFDALPAGVPEVVTSVNELVLGNVASLGLIPLAIVLTDLSDWAQDEDVTSKLWFSVSGLAIGNIILAIDGMLSAALEPINLAAFVVFFTVLASLLLLISLLVFALAIMQLAGMAKWAIRNAQSLRERRERAAERIAKEASSPPPPGPEEPMEMKDAPLATAEPTGSQEGTPATGQPQRQRTYASEKRFERGGDADPYELEP